MVALIMITSLIGAVALLKMDRAEQMATIEGEFGVESDVDIDEVEEEAEEVAEETPAEEPEEVDG
jgi:hypothetical protein